VIPDDLPTFTEVFSGGTVIGNLCWAVAASNAASLVLIVDESLSFESHRLFFAIP
jgi:hypothetical protein